MKKILVVVDMQKDFVDGSLGTKEAQAIVPAAAKLIRDFDGDIFVTLDTHGEDYMQTAEGAKLPVKHCIKGTEGYELDKNIAAALQGKKYKTVPKITFGSTDLPRLIKRAAAGCDFEIDLIGLCTDICVISNALILKARFPEAPVGVIASCCAGVTPELHEAALSVMKSCQIDVK